MHCLMEDNLKVKNGQPYNGLNVMLRHMCALQELHIAGPRLLQFHDHIAY